MKNAIYLGDIDPNNTILPVMNIRRTIMFQLLIWDKIILSDSQFLTDPRLNILMHGYNSDQVCQKYNITDVEESLKGIESLFQNGLIEVALRQNSNSESDLYNTWLNMSKSEKKVPYLPEDENYVHYLKSLSYHTHSYKTDNMSQLFQNNLESGINTDPLRGGITLHRNDVETELKRMFQEKAPLFRNILDFMQKQVKEGKLSPERYQRLYDYVYSCYSVNTSAVLGCNINTKFAHIPFHIESGSEYIGNNISQKQVERLRPTWALNPIFLDHLTFEEFTQIRRQLKTSKVREFYTGSVESPWVEIEDAWESYTLQLENAIKLAMYEKKDALNTRLIKELSGEKYITNPTQQTIVTPVYEVVKSLVSFVPVVGNAMGVIDFAKTLCDSVVTISKYEENMAFARDYADISQLVSKETRVITKYDNPFSK